MSELNKPAMPAMPGLHPSAECRYSEEGMTLRHLAAITLRVPMSGDPELDAMIRDARRLDIATAAMQGMLADPDFNPAPEETARLVLYIADTLLAASDPMNDE